MLKKILTLIFEPLKAFANRNLAEKISMFFSKNKWMTYLLSVLITIIVVLMFYVF
jgi:hypothetical protein